MSERSRNFFFSSTFVLEKSLIYKLIGFKSLEHLPHRQQPTQPPIWSYMGGLYALSSHTGCCGVCRTGLLLPWERGKGEAGLGVSGRTGLLAFEQSLRDERTKIQLLLQEGTKDGCRPPIWTGSLEATLQPPSSVWVHWAVQSSISSASYKGCFTLSQKFATLRTC